MTKPTLHGYPRGIAYERAIDLALDHRQSVACLQRALAQASTAEPIRGEYPAEHLYLAALNEHRQRLNCIRGLIESYEQLALACEQQAKELAP